jgi:hypothetical protein
MIPRQVINCLFYDSEAEYIYSLPNDTFRPIRILPFKKGRRFWSTIVFGIPNANTYYRSNLATHTTDDSLLDGLNVGTMPSYITWYKRHVPQELDHVQLSLFLLAI